MNAHDHEEDSDNDSTEWSTAFGNIISTLSGNTEPSSQLAALNELGELLSFSTLDPLSINTSMLLSPLVVRLVNHDDIPIMFSAMRNIAYMFDASPSSIDHLVIHGVVPALCQRLLALEYEEVAEQTLSEQQPIPCLKGGVIMAVLKHFDFFSTRSQRRAISTVMNIATDFRSENISYFMEAVPILCNILRYEDREIVENAAAYLIKVVRQVDHSSGVLDELCEHGLIEQVAHLLSLNGGRTIREFIKDALITCLVKLASGSVIAFRTLHDLNITNILKDMLSTSDRGHEILKLLNELLPAMTIDQNDAVMLEKESILANRPDLLQKFGKDVLHQLIQMFNTDADLNVCHGSLSVVHKLIYFSESDLLVELLKNANIASCLTRVFTQKDHHVLMLALQIVELILQKVSDKFLKSFIKEGVFAAIEALFSPETSFPFHSPVSGGIHQPFDSIHRFASQENYKCLCHAFSSGHSPASSETGNCKLDKDSIYDFSKHIKAKYITPELCYSEKGFSDVLQNLKSLSTALNDLLSMSTDNGTLCLDEEKINSVLHQILETLNGKEEVTTFEFIESGVIKSLLGYLSKGQDMGENGGVQGFSGYDAITEKRFEALVKVSLFASNPLSSIISNLQSALIYSEDYYVIPNDAHGQQLRSSVADVPNECSIPYPCLRVRFINDKGETYRDSFNKHCFSVDPFCPLYTIEEYLWQRISVRSSIQEQELQANDKADPKLERQSSASRRDEDVQKLVFYLHGEKLDRNLTLYQEILGQAIRSNQSDSVRNPWRKVHTLTYRRAAESMDMIPQEHLCSPQDLSICAEVTAHNQKTPDQEKSSLSSDILLLLQIMECLNRYIPHRMSSERIRAFAEGKVDSLDSLKVVVPCVAAQNEFVNSKLTEKLEQQMSDTLAVCIGAIPMWWNILMDSCPFLFNFETKYKYLKLAARGQPQNQHHLALDNTRTSDRELSLGGLPRMKLVVCRSRILEYAAQIMDQHASKKVVFDVEYYGEAGTGRGPTVEFYTLVCQEFQKCGLGMWREDTCSSTIKTHLQAEEMRIHSLYGLFPLPLPETSGGLPITEVTKKFFLLGQVVAKAIQEGRVLDLPFSKAFCRLILQKELSLYDIQSFDPELGKLLQEFLALVNRKKYLESLSEENPMVEHGLSFRGTRIEDLYLDFTLPGYPDFASGSHDSMVNMSNLEAYVSFITDATVGSGISRQREAFISGFNQVFPIKHLHIFNEEELERIFCGEQDTWPFNNLAAHIKFEHGYTASSPPIVNFLEIVQEFDREQRRAFLQFVTGAPCLPVGGLASLKPMLTIVRKRCSFKADMELPSVMTCANYLKLPPYSSKEIMKKKLLHAITEGQGSFQLS